MFYDCENLVELDLSSFNFSNVSDMIDIFSYCFNLFIMKINKINFLKIKGKIDINSLWV